MSPKDPLTPKDHAERVALFRSEVIGALTRRELDHGGLRAELQALAETAFRPPDGDLSRRYSVPTLERWYYAYRRGGLVALAPRPRSDRGRGRELTPEQHALLVDIRREHPSPRCRSSCARSSPMAGWPKARSRLRQSGASIATKGSTEPRSRAAAPARARPGSSGRPSARVRSGTATSATGLRSSWPARRGRFASTVASTTPRAMSLPSRPTTRRRRSTCWASWSRPSPARPTRCALPR
jgi:hypothetical protein